jgi:ribonucleoside-diphosphate reductase alpha chain
MGHVRMMGAVQPFLSGAISKTINMPKESTPEDIETPYRGWKLGLKAVAIYRDGSKRSQPLNTKADAAKEEAKPEERLARRRLPDERRSITHKFSIGGHEGYMTVGMYDDGTPGELFVTMAKEGSVVSGLMDNFATMISMSLQYGVPLQGPGRQVLPHPFRALWLHRRTPRSPSRSRSRTTSSSWLAMKFLPRDSQEDAGVILRDLGDMPSGPTGSSAPSTPSGAGPTSSGSTGGGAKASATNVVALNRDDKKFVKELATPAGLPLTPRPSSLAPQNAVVMLPERNADEPRRKTTFLAQADAPSCSDCGSIMVRNGACYKCLNCGSTSGCS